jgi:hypothetical protein
MNWGKLFRHYKGEYFLGDYGYDGCSHCLVPFKHADVNIPLPDKERHFNRIHRTVRSRVERLFAFFDVFRFFGYTAHEEAWVMNAVIIVVNLFYLLYCTQPHYTDTTEDQHLNDGTHEECFCSIGCGVPVGIAEQRKKCYEEIIRRGVSYEPKNRIEGDKN